MVMGRKGQASWKLFKNCWRW